MAKRVGTNSNTGGDFQCRYCDDKFDNVRSRGSHESHHTRYLDAEEVKTLRDKIATDRIDNEDALALSARERAHRNGTTLKQEKAIAVDSLTQIQKAVKKSVDGAVLGVIVVTIEDWQEKCRKADAYDRIMMYAEADGKV